MAKKKRHHYIPKFYLKRFSINNNGKFIGLYNYKNDVFVQEAPLRHQAYENFLYGEDDEIENTLADMESNVAKMFFYWTEEKLLYPPPVASNGFKLLKRFILYQAFRTPKSGNDIMETLNESLKVVLKDFKPDLWHKIKDGNLAHKNPALLGLLHSAKHENLLNHLDCKFVVNLSLLPLITSDAPVVFYNQLMEKAGNYAGATGLVAKGLQIFYPIHSRLMICLYDPNVYDLGNGCINCCSTESIDEIHQLNVLQFINSEAQLFFDDTISEEYIKETCNQYKEYKASPKKINSIINQGSRKLFLMSSEDAHINLNLDFFKFKVKPNDYKNEIAPLRHSSFKRPIENIFLRD
jgi:hypothetical protein